MTDKHIWSLILLLFSFAYCTAEREPWLPASCPDNTTAFLRQYAYVPSEDMKAMTLEDLKTGLSMCQQIANIPITGECDSATVEKMNAKRCGCEDIVFMDQKKMMTPQNYYGPLEYRIGRTKWDENTLTWKITQYPRRNQFPNSEVDACMARAFKIWADVSPLNFRQERNPSAHTDIDIQFLTGRHTTRPPYYDFDGRGKVLAHAFFPQSGVVHFDDDETFVIGSNEGTELCIVAAHEFGHTLGISHSNVEEALMAPYYRYMENLKLHQDDIDAIQAIYGAGGKVAPSTTLRTVPTTRPTFQPRPSPRARPEFCDLKIKAGFKIGTTTYIFTYERVFANYYRTYIYEVDDTFGIKVDSRTPIYRMFNKEVGRKGRGYPSQVNAAAYFPDSGFVFLFSGTRVYRYRQRSGRIPFVLDHSDAENTYPRWIEPYEFPEPVQAAIPFPYSRGGYYLFLFGRTMAWQWQYYQRPKETVGAWAYPMNIFGQNMPLNVDAAVVYNKYYAYLFRGDRYYTFNILQRRIDDRSPSRAIGEFFKNGCQ